VTKTTPAELETPIHSVTLTPQITVGSNNPLLIIAGPCQIESLTHCLHIAGFLKELCAKLPVQLVFKASFDKANRLRIGSTRGVGIESGLEILAETKKQSGLPVLTDVHTAEQAHTVAQYVDVLQTPAFLCRQTDLLLAVGKTGKAINVKKGQFLAPEDMRFAAEKIASTGNKNLMLCERGATFGYRDLIVDMRSLAIMRSLGYPVVFDVTHSIQSPGGSGGQSGGDRRFVRPLARAAAAVGIDGLFFECHDNPERAPSDAQSMLPLSAVEELLHEVLAIRAAV
jgi:2-dehydro-3-deoxyphosphooctonate aldolase (KDO 8-P synthase)